MSSIAAASASVATHMRSTKGRLTVFLRSGIGRPGRPTALDPDQQQDQKDPAYKAQTAANHHTGRGIEIAEATLVVGVGYCRAVLCVSPYRRPRGSKGTSCTDYHR